MATTVTANVYTNNRGIQAGYTPLTFTLGIRRNGQYVNYVAISESGDEYQVGSYFTPRKSSRIDYPANHPVAAWLPLFEQMVRNHEMDLPRTPRPQTAAATTGRGWRNPDREGMSALEDLDDFQGYRTP